MVSKVLYELRDVGAVLQLRLERLLEILTQV